MIYEDFDTNDCIWIRWRKCLKSTYPRSMELFDVLRPTLLVARCGLNIHSASLNLRW
jgi:hypothetical protein